ncbi:MAG: hypothetical protein KKE30_18415, partial [Gammaproteobacteria bacterium]|nr:hypothetical protein [Gammaproteobacteria bacterium]
GNDEEGGKNFSKLHSFYIYMQKNLPENLFEGFNRTYFPSGYDPFSKREPIKLYIDYFTKITEYDGHLGSSFGGTASSSLNMLLLTIPKKEHFPESEFYQILFNYIYSKLNHRDVDSRITLFNLAYSHYALTGCFEERIVNFFGFCLQKLKNSIQHTDDGDFFEQLFFEMVSSENFLFSTAMKNNLKVEFTGETNLKICISDKYTRKCVIHPDSKIEIIDIKQKHVFNSINSGFYVNEVIFIQKENDTK